MSFLHPGTIYRFELAPSVPLVWRLLLPHSDPAAYSFRVSPLLVAPRAECRRILPDSGGGVRCRAIRHRAGRAWHRPLSLSLAVCVCVRTCVCDDTAVGARWVFQVFYNSKDGTRVPMFLVYAKGRQRCAEPAPVMSVHACV
jgi:hypothetical protein